MESEDAWRLTDKLHVEHGKGDPFAAAIRATRMAMIITDPRQPDNPIVFANDALLRLTGYDRDEIVGKNCRFLQGPDTDPAAVDQLRSAIREGRDVAVDILNYRKSGECFWNALYISPVRNEAGELLFFFSSQLDVTDRKTAEIRTREEKVRFELEVYERTAELRTALSDLASANAELKRALDAKTVLLHEVDHRVKNNLQIIASLIGVQHRRLPEGSDSESLRATLRRVEALATVHRRLYQSEDVRRFAAGAFLRDLVGDLAASNAIPLELELDIADVEIPTSKAAPLALTLNEVLALHLNALPEQGAKLKTSLRVQPNEGRFEIDIRSSASSAPAKTDGAPSFERTVLNALSRQLGAELERFDSNSERGSRLRVAMNERDFA